VIQKTYVELLKSRINKLYKIIMIIINQCLNREKMPDERKITYISSIHKKSDKKNPNSYISITSTMSRLYGRRDLIEIEYQKIIKKNNLV
jgi:hypothetical protein